MSERVIPLVDQRIASLAPPAAAFSPASRITATGLLADGLGRPLRDLRISVTDRCNFRCNYCMPKEIFDKDYPYLPHSALLSFEEITRLASVFVAHGVRKIRLTGGEPLLRKNIEVLIEQLAALRTVDGEPLDLTLTTNGSLLARKAKALKAAGLQRVTVSLDGLDDAVFRRMNDVDFPVADVLAGIEAARAAGLGPIKINMVVKRGTNEHEILPMVRHFKGSGMVLRFIEYMDVGATNGWRMDEVLPSSEVVKLINAELPLVQLDPSAPGETANAGALPMPAAGMTRAPVKLASSAVSPRLSARTATAPASPPKANSICACLPAKGTTCAHCCARAPAMPTWPQRWATSGRVAPTATRNSEAPWVPTPARPPRAAASASR